MRKLVTAILSSATALAVLCLAPAISQAAPCDGAGSEQPFLDWHDQASYVLVSGGDFESTTTDWGFTGGAAVVPGGNTLRSASSANALDLPAGAAATTPAICVGKGDPVARIFMRSVTSGKRGAKGLKVQVLYLNKAGDVRKVKKAGQLRGGTEWAPSRRFGLAQGQFGHGAKAPPSDPGNGQSDDPHGQGDAPHGQAGGAEGDGHGATHHSRTGSIKLRFTAPSGTEWQIDDVFVDPRARR